MHQFIAEVPDGSSQQEIIDLKIKNAALEQKVEMLTEDRNYLRERLREGKDNFIIMKNRCY